MSTCSTDRQAQDRCFGRPRPGQLCKGSLSIVLPRPRTPLEMQQVHQHGQLPDRSHGRLVFCTDFPDNPHIADWRAWLSRVQRVCLTSKEDQCAPCRACHRVVAQYDKIKQAARRRRRRARNLSTVAAPVAGAMRKFRSVHHTLHVWGSRERTTDKIMALPSERRVL